MKVVNILVNDPNKKVIAALERELEVFNLQLEKSNRENEELSKRIQPLSEQVRHLINLLFGSNSEKDRYQDENHPSLFDDVPFFNAT